MYTIITTESPCGSIIIFKKEVYYYVCTFKVNLYGIVLLSSVRLRLGMKQIYNVSFMSGTLSVLFITLTPEFKRVFSIYCVNK